MTSVGRYFVPVCPIARILRPQMSTLVPWPPSGERLEDLVGFETLVTELSTQFVALTADNLDDAIEDALRRVCQHLGIDAALLWQWSAADPAVVRPTHGWPALRDLPRAEPLRQDQYPWVVAQVMAGRRVVLPSLDETPAEGAVDRESGRRAGIQSNLTLPLVVGGEPPVGALAFNTLRARRDWPEAVVKRLELVAQIFTNALARRRHEESLRESEERLALAADSAGAGLWTLDYESGRFWTTEKARAIFGYPPDEDVTMDRLREWVHPDDWGAVRTTGARSARPSRGPRPRAGRSTSSTAWSRPAPRGRPGSTPSGAPCATERVVSTASAGSPRT